jgi:HopA1 effector protein family
MFNTEILTEIINKIEIDSLFAKNFGLRHVDYYPIEFEPDTITRFQKVSPDLRTKYFKVQVQNYLHDIYFDRSLLNIQELTTQAQNIHQVKNNLVDGIDIDFHQRLQKSNTSNGYFDPNWQVVAEADDGMLIVTKDGLNLHIDRKQHLPKDRKKATNGDIVPIYLPNNLVGQDTYIMVGNFGVPNLLTTDREQPEQLVELYFNFAPDAAVEIGQKLTRGLNKLGIPFQFAVLHDPNLFHRYDSGKLLLSQTAYLSARTILVDIYRSHQTDFDPQIPLFTKQIAPGLGIAEIPNSRASGEQRSVSFGRHRCELLAAGLLEIAQQDRVLTSQQLSVIEQHLTDAGIDPLQPYLNPKSVDVYEEFELT